MLVSDTVAQTAAELASARDHVAMLRKDVSTRNEACLW
jgi:hypothetical protein